MAIAGGMTHAARCEVVDGKLQVTTRSYFPRDLVEHDIEQAILRLDAGQVVYLHDYGLNVANVQRAFDGGEL